MKSILTPIVLGLFRGTGLKQYKTVLGGALNFLSFPVYCLIIESSWKAPITTLRAQYRAKTVLNY